MELKICKRCSNSRDLSQFSKNNHRKDKLHPICKECTKLIRIKDLDKRLEAARVDYKKNREVRLIWQNQYHVNNRQDILIRQKEYYSRNRGDMISNQKKYHYNKLKTDINYKLSCNLRTRIFNAIKKDNKTGSAVRDLGCSIQEFKIYLESKFQEGMNWDNWSRDGWHIDHIMPLSKFNLCNREEFLRVCHYTNLQPLWSKDNISKGNK